MKRQRVLPFILLLAALWAMPRRAAAQIFSVRVNTLAALTATAEIGVDVSLADKWTVELSGYWNPLRTASLTTRFHAVQVGTRYWFYESFVGHYLGQHITYIGYDMGSRTRHFEGYACGIGFSYGHAWMLSKRWNVAIEAGIGLFRTKDTRRDPRASDWEDELIYHNLRWSIAPSKLEVAFSYLF